MSTTKSRINISIGEEVVKALSDLAKRDQVPAATKAKQLLEIGLEIEEDEVWNEIAAKRDIKNARFRTHAQAFGS